MVPEARVTLPAVSTLKQLRPRGANTKEVARSSARRSSWKAGPGRLDGARSGRLSSRPPARCPIRLGDTARARWADRMISGSIVTAMNLPKSCSHP